MKVRLETLCGCTQELDVLDPALGGQFVRTSGPFFPPHTRIRIMLSPNFYVTNFNDLPESVTTPIREFDFDRRERRPTGRTVPAWQMSNYHGLEQFVEQVEEVLVYREVYNPPVLPKPVAKRKVLPEPEGRMISLRGPY
jgi:hypothetical protein